MAIKVTIERSYPVGEAATKDNPPTSIHVEGDTVEEAVSAIESVETQLGYNTL